MKFCFPASSALSTSRNGVLPTLQGNRLHQHLPRGDWHFIPGHYDRTSNCIKYHKRFCTHSSSLASFHLFPGEKKGNIELFITAPILAPALGPQMGYFWPNLLWKNAPLIGLSTDVKLSDAVKFSPTEVLTRRPRNRS